MRQKTQVRLYPCSKGPKTGPVRKFAKGKRKQTIPGKRSVVSMTTKKRGGLNQRREKKPRMRKIRKASVRNGHKGQTSEGENKGNRKMGVKRDLWEFWDKNIHKVASKKKGRKSLSLGGWGTGFKAEGQKKEKHQVVEPQAGSGLWPGWRRGEKNWVHGDRPSGLGTRKKHEKKTEGINFKRNTKNKKQPRSFKKKEKRGKNKGARGGRNRCVSQAPTASPTKKGGGGFPNKPKRRSAKDEILFWGWGRKKTPKTNTNRGEPKMSGSGRLKKVPWNATGGGVGARGDHHTTEGGKSKVPEESKSPMQGTRKLGGSWGNVWET